MPQKPKILLVIDRPDWAFGYIASCLVDHLSDNFEFTTITCNQSYNEDHYDLIYLLSWTMYQQAGIKIKNRSKYITAPRSFTAEGGRNPIFKIRAKQTQSIPGYKAGHQIASSGS